MQPLHFNNNNNSSFDIIKNITIWQHGNNRIITIGKADIMLSLTKQDPGRRLHKQNKKVFYTTLHNCTTNSNYQSAQLYNIF